MAQALSQLNETNLPSFSIHLQGDTEDEQKAFMNDCIGTDEVPITPEVVVPTFNATSYNIKTGKITIPDSADLMNVYKNRYFIDGMGQEFKILDDVSNQTGNKYVYISTDIQSIDLNNAKIVSAINSDMYNVKEIPTNETIMIGVHSENALFTKYLYYILRYILYRYKNKFKNFGMLLAKFNGSDFSLNQSFISEQVYSRFITAQFVSYNSWREDKLIQIDNMGDRRYIDDEFDPVSYDSYSGFLAVADSVDLSGVIAGDIFEDAAGVQFKILGGINNTNGLKGFLIPRGGTVDLTNGASISRYYKPRVIKDGSEREDGDLLTWDTEENEEED